jgi:hypothetical protein
MLSCVRAKVGRRAVRRAVPRADIPARLQGPFPVSLIRPSSEPLFSPASGSSLAFFDARHALEHPRVNLHARHPLHDDFGRCRLGVIPDLGRSFHPLAIGRRLDRRQPFVELERFLHASRQK